MRKGLVVLTFPSHSACGSILILIWTVIRFATGTNNWRGGALRKWHCVAVERLLPSSHATRTHCHPMLDHCIDVKLKDEGTTVNTYGSQSSINHTS